MKPYKVQLLNTRSAGNDRASFLMKEKEQPTTFGATVECGAAVPSLVFSRLRLQESKKANTAPLVLPPFPLSSEEEEEEKVKEKGVKEVTDAQAGMPLQKLRRNMRSKIR